MEVLSGYAGRIARKTALVTHLLCLVFTFNLSLTMTIIENSFLHLSTLLLFLAGFGFLLFGYLKNNQLYFNRAFRILILGCIQSLFIGVVNSNFFILSSKGNYEANFIFTFATALILVVSIWGIVVYYRHRIAPPIIPQLAIAFSAIIVITTFSTSVNNQIGRMGNHSKESTRFIKAEEFQKGTNPELSRLPSTKDSVNKQ